MNLTINNQRMKSYQPNFKSTILTSVLQTLDTNPMANAVLLDLGTMVGPRTFFDTKDRNKYAGSETFFRELSGTFINCLSAGILGSMFAKIAGKHVNPQTKINPKSWFSDESINVLTKAWNHSENNVEKYIENVFNNIQAQDGRQKVTFKNIDWNKVQWFDENKWQYFHWDNPDYEKIGNNLKTPKNFIKTFAKIINDKEISKHDKKQVFEIIEKRLINALKAERDIEVKIEKTNWNTNIKNILRDTYDMAKDVFTNPNVNTEFAIAKIKKVNNIKIFGALSLASALGVSAQHINRKISEKRTGRKGFVGEVDYMSNDTKVETNNTKYLNLNKILACAGMIAMVLGVMKVKNPKDFVKKLQFTGPVSTGNAIKTVYASTIIGRFLAADSNNELRESVVRDYFGFLNWLVLGGFAAKGIANILDRKKEYLFNIKKEGHGIKHWLNDITLKTHDELKACGKEIAQKNIKILNIAHIGGLAYSTLMLGILLPKINTKMTKHSHKQKQKLQST